MLIKSLEEYKANGFVKTKAQPDETPPCYTNPTPDEMAEFSSRDIVYANPLRTAQLLTPFFSEVGSDASIEFERILQAAILKHEAAKNPAVVVTFPPQKRVGQPVQQYG